MVPWCNTPSSEVTCCYYKLGYIYYKSGQPLQIGKDILVRNIILGLKLGSGDLISEIRLIWIIFLFNIIFLKTFAHFKYALECHNYVISMLHQTEYQFKWLQWFKDCLGKNKLFYINILLFYMNI